MWQFEQATKGMADACRELNTPVISGNVSLYNETVLPDKRINIYPTPIVVAVGVLDKPENAIPSFYQNEGDVIAIVGEVDKEPTINGSEFLKEVHGIVSGEIPPVNLEVEKKLAEFFQENKHLIKSAHDVSDGGLITAILESAFSEEKTFGVDVSINTPYREDFELFDEMRSIIVISLEEKDLKAVKEAAQNLGIGFKTLGRVIDKPVLKLKINSINIEEDISSLRNLWENSVRKLLD